MHEIYWHSENFRFRFHDNAYNCPLHTHSHAELVYVADGEITLSVYDKTCVLKKNQAALLFPWQPRSYVSTQENRVFIIVFAENVIPEFFHLVKEKTAVSHRFKADILLQNMIEACKDEPTRYTIKALLYHGLDVFLKTAEFAPKRKETEVIDKLITYTSQNLSSDLALEDVAHSLGYSKNYLSHLIKTNTGMNFRALLNCMKFELAKDMIRNSNKSMTEIAFASHFGTERSFHRSFKALSGITPKEYKKQ